MAIVFSLRNRQGIQAEIELIDLIEVLLRRKKLFKIVEMTGLKGSLQHCIEALKLSPMSRPREAKNKVDGGGVLPLSYLPSPISHL